MRRPAWLRAQLIALLAVASTGCGSAVGPTVSPSVMPTAVPSAATSVPPSPNPAATTPAASLPPGISPWPTTFSVAFAGTYWSNPPFRIPFSITIDEPGWFSGHLHAEFVDLQRFDGMTQHQFPNRMIAFGDPAHIRSAGDDVAVAGLTPDAALDLMVAERASLTAANKAPQSLFGLDGARIDVHSVTSNNPLFGGADGDFGLGPELDVRLVLLPLDGRLLAVAVLAAPGDLDGAWVQALPVLETVELAP